MRVSEQITWWVSTIEKKMFGVQLMDYWKNGVFTVKRGDGWPADMDYSNIIKRK